MSLKKLFVIPAALTIAFGAVNTASAGDVVSACKVVNERDHWMFGSKCGARGDLRWILGAAGLGTGAAIGTATGTIFGPLGALGGLVAGGYAGGRLGGRMARHYRADEYIYFDNGDCIECDKHQVGEDWECPQGTIVTNGVEVYKCNVGSFNDSWEKIDLHVCGDSPVQQASLKSDHRYRSYIKDAVTQNGIELKPGVRKYSGAACIWIEEIPQQQNQNTDPTNSNTNTNINSNSSSSSSSSSIGDINIIINSCIDASSDSRCRDMKQEQDCETQYRGFPELIACCIHEKVHLTTMQTGRNCQCTNPEYQWDDEKWTCVKKSQRQNRQTCEQRYGAYPERLACCKAGNLTYWEGDVATGKCICGNSNTRVPNGKKWIRNGNTGYCTDVTNPDPHDPDPHNPDPHNPDPHNPDPHVNTSVTCNYNFGVKVKCKNGASLEAAQSWSFTFSSTDGVSVNQNGMCVLPLTNNLITASTLMQRFCAEKGSVVYDGPDDAAVEAAKSSLQSFFQTAQSSASVWKNADGQFNTARLASDATAGIVLGTVGGIVSAKVIKKKQLEKGYDALNCTIGGQKIADWGDEFQVGYSR
ncbi:MAG: hypothetical protein J6W27_02660 [Alphaproteobacteria bacterium]|nr:hypothetical protein [Alphaproteobacteria bacterium]